MGSPISAVLANVFMEWFEDAMLNSAAVIQTACWRYVDDTFVLLDKSSVPQFHGYISNQEESLVFTKDQEDEK